MAACPPLHEDLKPLEWILGRWRGEGSGEYPTIKNFTYGEELFYYHTGHDYIHFVSKSWETNSKFPLHLESGFMRIQKDTNKITLVIAHNIGFSDLEEGEVNGKQLDVESRSISVLSSLDCNHPTKVKRMIRRDGEGMEQMLWLTTTKTDQTQHLKIRYKKIRDDEAELKQHL